MFTKLELGRKIPGALEKLSGGKWKWEPEWGDIVIQPPFDTPFIYKGIARAINGARAGKFESVTGTEVEATLVTFIPLLHWEKLEQQLETWKYKIDVIKHAGIYVNEPYFEVKIYELHNMSPLAIKLGKTRQEAVQRAVLALTEEK